MLLARYRLVKRRRPDGTSVSHVPLRMRPRDPNQLIMNAWPGPQSRRAVRQDVRRTCRAERIRDILVFRGW
jgi:hypothetical protein